MIASSPLIPFQVFIAYSSRNKRDRQAMDTHLATLKKRGWISVWHDHEISPGADYQEQIDKNLNTADLILLLISADFLSSDACRAEMDRSLARHNNKTAIVVPIILGACGWKLEKIARLEALPEKGKAVSRYNNRDDAFALVAEGLHKLLFSAEDFILERRVVSELRLLQERLMKQDLAQDYIDLVAVRQDSTADVGQSEITLEDETNRWRQALVEEGRHLIEAEGGAGKTTFLKRLVWKTSTQDAEKAPAPWYLYITRYTNRPAATSLDILYEEIMDARARVPKDQTPTLGTLAAESSREQFKSILTRLAENGRTLVCVDGYDQAEPSPLITNFFSSPLLAKHAIVCSRPLESDLSLRREPVQGFTRWQLRPVSLRQAEHYLDTRWTEPSIQAMKKASAGRKLLRMPLFLEVAKHLDDRSPVHTTGDLMLRYWEHCIRQENRARSAPTIDDESARKLMQAVEKSSYQLAIRGQIERFSLMPLDDPDIRSMVELLKTIPGELDILRFGTYEGFFKHQAFQEYLTARALANNCELTTQISARLDAQTGFWHAMMTYLPAALLHTGRAADAASRVWEIVTCLMGGGHPLAAWILVEAARRDGIDLGDGDGWLYIVFQLIRYRRDIAQYFPKNIEQWHYDPLVLAISAVDRFSAEQHQLLRNGIRSRLPKLGALDVENFGIYELVTVWSDWNGEVDDLDRHRAAFVLGTQEGHTRIGNALTRYLDAKDGPSRVGGRFTTDWKRLGTALASSNPEVFGGWLRDHLADIQDSTSGDVVRQSFEKFEEEAFDPDMIPREQEFWAWAAASLVDDLVRGIVPPYDVLLSLFDSNVHQQLPRFVSAKYKELKEFVLRGLSSEEGSDFGPASLIAGEMRSEAQTERNSDPQFISEMREGLRTAFDRVESTTDVQRAYLTYHELTRLEDDEEWLVRLRDHILRYFAEEVHWFGPYERGDHIDFVEQRLADERYEKKHWLYFYEIPMLNAEAQSIVALLSRLDRLELTGWEANARNWAQQVISSLREFKEKSS